MLISEKLNPGYLFQEKIVLNKRILDRLAQVDTIVFDIDGVLIDVRESFRRAICRTVQFYFKEILHFQGSQNLIGPEEIEYFKMTGGFNDDWDLTSAVVLFYLIKAKEDNSKDIDELKMREPDIKTFITKRLSHGGGLTKVIDSIEKDGHAKEWILSLWDKDLITKIFQEIYAGEEYCFNIYGFYPSLIKTEGLIKQERIIIDKKKKDFLLQYFSIGILTGRNRGEARIALERLGWDDIISEEKIITADDGLEKPHPQGLKRLSASLKTKLGIYVGDIWDDLITAKNFNKEIIKTNFLSAIVLAEGFNLQNETVKFYLNEGVDLLAQDVNCILDRLERVKNSKK
ncbi:MAG: hypothetical protein COZ07_04705 [Candidatus Infernicultor aquiphilus]|uniref:phosphoglycolate phosphatase n=1 Tax=Candidatus Infernicultor aquiphilus TaxID=1805029 RepID=A0A1J5GBT2_9BACT|nr:HAD-IA family hydrolase [bacterium]OIP69707.1 MAG: hypothetical protein AUK42_04995 [Candidatus Atribacteria bacterium CG2_30_33_13]PIU25729.1 MAG: hypothetical protein COT11_01235 [Candidatus Atribacteria bacterium CG08_land_8_20_14_0_20_33_29]PIW11331.1 MAG: hypothetical protein COW35_07600 [Candidatus Atribacteria bacterium CG17_big_fil_post_rev_8_21_14_2_50_34_11]PIX34842.1 MAG: hypothetical protein COZ58_02410 [Candidatus Atribacteria bacterium CG_4_8_14_3_um_filter_34_18]PIY32733.1 MA